MDGIEIGQSLADLSDVVDGGLFASGGGGPHITNGLEKPPRHIDLVLPRRAEIDVAEQGPLHVAAEKGLPAVAVKTSLDVRHQPGDEAIPLVHGLDLFLNLDLGSFLPDERLVMTDGDTAHQGAADAAPELLDLNVVPGRRRPVADQLLQMQVLVKLQAFTGEDEQRGLPDVEDRITDPLQEFCDEEMRDDEARILSRPHDAAKGLRERLPVLPVELAETFRRIVRPGQDPG